MEEEKKQPKKATTKKTETKKSTVAKTTTSKKENSSKTENKKTTTTTTKKAPAKKKTTTVASKKTPAKTTTKKNTETKKEVAATTKKETKPKETKKEKVVEEVEEIKIQEEVSPKKKAQNKEKELEKIAEEIQKVKKLPEDKTKSLNKAIFRNMLVAMAVLVYGIFLILGFARIEYATYILDLRVFSIMLILIIIAIYEKAYKKDSGEIAIYGIELLPLAIGTLILPSIFEDQYARFVPLIASVTYVYAIYYIIKSIVQYAKRKSKFLKENQDIKDIVSAEEK